MKRTVSKSIGVALLLLLTVVMTSVLAIGCSKETKWDVKFYDGDTLITTKSVIDGGTVTRFSPADVSYSKEGFTFVEWFATADYTHEFDFATKITKATNVYSQWQSSQEDTRQWLIAGASGVGGPLKDIGWNGGAINEADLTNILTKAANKNEFSITIDLYVGDQFQFCIMDSSGAWLGNDVTGGGARGGQYLVANDYMAGASGGLGDGQVNIVVSVAGNYTLTLTTDALDQNFGKIIVKRNGDAPVITVDRSGYNWYIYGSSNSETEADSLLADMGWGAGLSSVSKYKLLKTTDNEHDGTGTWQITAKLDVDDEFMFGYLVPNSAGTSWVTQGGTEVRFSDISEFNGLENNFEGKGMGNNISVKVKGTYTWYITITENDDGGLDADVEVLDNIAFLKAEQDWAVLGRRLTTNDYVTNVLGLSVKDLTGEELTQMEAQIAEAKEIYENLEYSSDLEGNNWGLGDNVAAMTKVAIPSSGVIQYEITLDLGVGDYFYFCIPIFVNDVEWGNQYYTGGYSSTVVPAHGTGYPDGIGSVWTNNFACLEEGTYKFVITVDANAAMNIVVTEITD